MITRILGRSFALLLGCVLVATTWAGERDKKDSSNNGEDIAVRFAGLDNAADRWAADGNGGRPSFIKHVVPLLNKVGCSNRTCHGSFQGQNGFRLSLFGYDPQLDHDELIKDEGAGPRVDVDDIDNSLALLKPLSDDEHEGGRRFEKNSWQHRICGHGLRRALLSMRSRRHISSGWKCCRGKPN